MLILSIIYVKLGLVRKNYGYVPVMEMLQAYGIRHTLKYHIDENNMIF
jgi:hypothetical protein